MAKKKTKPKTHQKTPQTSPCPAEDSVSTDNDMPEPAMGNTIATQEIPHEPTEDKKLPRKADKKKRKQFRRKVLYTVAIATLAVSVCNMIMGFKTMRSLLEFAETYESTQADTKNASAGSSSIYSSVITYADDNTEISDVSDISIRYLYNEDGSLAQKIYLEDGGIKKTVKYIYDGILTQKIEYDSDGDTLYTHSFLYDAAGNITKETVRDAGRDVYATYISTYDGSGSRTIQAFDKEGNLKNTYVYTYDTDGNLAGLEYTGEEISEDSAFEEEPE